MNFSEKLTALRRREGMSQEQLADRLGVTRQSVSKWEGGAAQPELAKLVALSEMFHVSVDYLVKDYMEEPEQTAAGASSTAKLEEQVEEISRYFRAWEWNSETTLFGLPLVSVCFCFYPHMLRCRKTARGIIAIGNIAVGVIAVGLLSAGLVSVGALSIGLFALGALAFGAAALGPVAIGLLAFGPVALGLCWVHWEPASSRPKAEDWQQLLIVKNFAPDVIEGRVLALVPQPRQHGFQQRSGGRMKQEPFILAPEKK